MGYILAIVRAILIAILMVIMVAVYFVLDLIFNFSREQSYTLRKMFLNYVFIPINNIKIIKTGTGDVDTPTLFASNHRSLVDIIIFKYIDALIIAKAEIADYPIFSKGAEMTGIIWLKRESLRSRARTKELISETLQEGYNIALFPEGTVSIDQGTLPFKRGSFSVAADLGIPVKPVTIEFRHKADLWDQPSLIKQYFRVFSRWKTEVKVDIGEVMYGNDSTILAQDVEDLINRKLSELQQGWSTVWPDGHSKK